MYFPRTSKILNYFNDTPSSCIEPENLFFLNSSTRPKVNTRLIKNPAIAVIYLEISDHFERFSKSLSNSTMAFP